MSACISRNRRDRPSEAVAVTLSLIRAATEEGVGIQAAPDSDAYEKGIGMQASCPVCCEQYDDWNYVISPRD